MEKLFVQDIDWHIADKQTGKYLGEVFNYESETQISLTDKTVVPQFIQQQLDLGFARRNDNGHIVIPTSAWNSMTEVIDGYLAEV